MKLHKILLGFVLATGASTFLMPLDVKLNRNPFVVGMGTVFSNSTDFLTALANCFPDQSWFAEVQRDINERYHSVLVPASMSHADLVALSNKLYELKKQITLNSYEHPLSADEQKRALALIETITQWINVSPNK